MGEILLVALSPYQCAGIGRIHPLLLAIGFLPNLPESVSKPRAISCHSQVSIPGQNLS